MENNPLKISLIEDDDDDIFLFSMALGSVSVSNKLTIIKDGVPAEENIRHLESTSPDIIFLDLLWKHTYGIHYLEEIRKNHLLKNTTCVVFSGSKEQTDIQSAFQAGANLYVVKPGDFAVMVDVINRTLALDWKDYSPPKFELFLLPGN